MPYFKPIQFNFGVRIPIRRNYYVQEAVSRAAEIAKTGTVMINSYEELNVPDVSAIYIKEGAQSVGGMEAHSYIEKVEIPASVVEIKENAFRDCINLKEVRLAYESSLSVIKHGAFENDTHILKIFIPATVQTIEKDAFKGWTCGQQIIISGLSKE